MKTFNFVGPKFDPATQRDLFLDDDELTPFEEHETMAHLLVRAGKFPSVSQARKNGWDKPIETNWNGIRVGKGMNMVEIFIFNPQHTAAELMEMFPEENVSTLTHLSANHLTIKQDEDGLNLIKVVEQKLVA